MATSTGRYNRAMTTGAATVATPPAPLSFREVLRIDVMRRVWYA